MDFETLTITLLTIIGFFLFLVNRTLNEVLKQTANTQYNLNLLIHEVNMLRKLNDSKCTSPPLDRNRGFI
jgi:hypothetical protein